MSKEEQYTVKDAIGWLQEALALRHSSMKVLTDGEKFWAFNVDTNFGVFTEVCEPGETIAQLADNLAAYGYRSWANLGPKLDALGELAWDFVQGDC